MALIPAGVMIVDLVKTLLDFIVNQQLITACKRWGKICYNEYVVQTVEKIMTFDEARQKHLAEFDSAVTELRKVVADPLWCNTLCNSFKSAYEHLMDSIGRVESLNDAEQTAKHKPS